MMKTKQLFKSHLFFLAALFSMALAAVSCANEDITQNGKTGENGKGFATFVADAPTQTRTSIDYATGNFYWEEGDKIYVKDDDGTIQVSNAVDAAHAHSASFKFKVPGKFGGSATYKVYYLGKNGGGNQVTIPTAQTQTKPNATDHLGDSGDYGTATATGTIGGDVFSFQLEHQATYLVFQPYTSNAVLKNCYLTKIEVSSDNDIAETYTIDPVTGSLTNSAGGKQIILTTKDPVAGSTNENGFSLNTTSPSLTINGAYMLIKPGEHVLKVRYWVKDLVTGTEGTITKALGSFDYKVNTYYDMTANLNVRDYDGMYYMWNAKQNYWYGHEWNSADPWQPTLVSQPANSHYPQNNGDDRWFNEDFTADVPNNASKNPLFMTLPNLNEMAWYCMKGDPRWDANEVWTTMEHLYKGGMWFKKKSKISNFSTAHIPDNVSIDLRTEDAQTIQNNTLNPDLPSASEIGDYFYLPALGRYYSGKFEIPGMIGFYWSSNAFAKQRFSSTYAGVMSFGDGFVIVQNNVIRDYGFRINPHFE